MCGAEMSGSHDHQRPPGSLTKTEWFCCGAFRLMSVFPQSKPFSTQGVQTCKLLLQGTDLSSATQLVILGKRRFSAHSRGGKTSKANQNSHSTKPLRVTRPALLSCHYAGLQGGWGCPVPPSPRQPVGAGLGSRTAQTAALQALSRRLYFRAGPHLEILV